jgi:hypothetical protein
MAKIFVGIPYGFDPVFQQKSYETTLLICARILKEGNIPVCPIQICHPLVKSYGDKMNIPNEEWESICNTYMDGCDAMYVICKDGFVRSPGLLKEINYAERIGIPISFHHEESFFFS